MGQRDSDDKRGTDDILLGAYHSLLTARFGLGLLTGPDHGARTHGLRILIVFGEASRDTLSEQLGRGEPDFETWWERYRVEMEHDDLMRFFAKQRHRTVHHSWFPDIEYHITAYPGGEGAVDFEARRRLTHKGKLIDSTDLPTLAGLYLDYLDDLVTSAGRRFGSPPVGARRFAPPLPWHRTSDPADRT